MDDQQITKQDQVIKEITPELKATLNETMPIRMLHTASLFGNIHQRWRQNATKGIGPLCC